MGIYHSSQQQQDHASAPEESPMEKMQFARLYKELRDKSDEDETPVEEGVFKNRFVNFFGGPCLEFGDLLYEKLFSEHATVDQDAFMAALMDLRKVSFAKTEHREVEKFFFSIFSGGKERLERKDLLEMVHVAATFALLVGSDLHERTVIPRDHPIITSMVNSSTSVADQETHELSVTQFTVWVTDHCPRLLQGIQHWVSTLVWDSPKRQEAIEGSGSFADPGNPLTSSGGTSPTPADPFKVVYQLPAPKMDDADDKKLQDMYIMIWALSTILPLVYMGHKEEDKAAKLNLKPPAGGAWTVLYHSDNDGFSINRFQHHSFDYREPSIMFLTCSNKEEEYVFAIAVDRQWRDGTHFWGGEQVRLLQLHPSFALITAGEKLLSLNEKARGFPLGLRVMENTDYKHCVLLMDSSFEKAVYNESLDLMITKIEVWGCGGVEAAESQKRLREWEKKEAYRRRKINKDEIRRNWEESPDRYLLTLGGVTIDHPKEQQQQ